MMPFLLRLDDGFGSGSFKTSLKTSEPDSEQLTAHLPPDACVIFELVEPQGDITSTIADTPDRKDLHISFHTIVLAQVTFEEDLSDTQLLIGGSVESKQVSVDSEVVLQEGFTANDGAT